VRQRCGTHPERLCAIRERMEATHQAYYDREWWGFVFPFNDTDFGHGWTACPWCDGPIREGLRARIMRVKMFGADTGEGDE
jgi:hypothetical protein